jgi:hypothetical protein
MSALPNEPPTTPTNPKREFLESAEVTCVRKRPRRLAVGNMPQLLAQPQQAERRVGVRVPRRRLFSIAFVWPEGVPWLGAAGSGGVKGRRAPRWYADCITEMILHFGNEGSFVIHVHGALGTSVIKALAQQWRSAFGQCAARGESLSISVCDAKLHPMFPVSARAVPLLDSKDERLVLCVDVHDSLARQSEAITYRTGDRTRDLSTLSLLC